MKYKIIIILLSISILLSSCGTKESVEVQDNPTELIMTTQEQTEIVVKEDNRIVEDIVVNGFLNECDFDYGEIKKGNIRTKFFVHINGCYTELLNSNTQELILRINGNHTDSINETEVINAFKIVAQTINEYEYEEDLEIIIEGLMKHNTEIYEGEIGDLKYHFYACTELSKQISESRIEISTSKYNAE